MKHLQEFKTVQDYDGCFNESTYVTSITCSDGNTYEYNGRYWGDINYHQWLNSSNNVIAITFMRDPGIGEWNPKLGTGAFISVELNNDDTEETPLSITSKTTETISEDTDPVTALSDIKEIFVEDSFNKKRWYEYVGEFDVEVGIAR